MTTNDCAELQDSNGNVADMCAVGGGTWSQSACDQSKYARKCVQSGTVSVNGGPSQPETWFYYFPAGSKTACLGTERALGSGAANPASGVGGSQSSTPPAAAAGAATSGSATLPMIPNTGTTQSIVAALTAQYCTVTLSQGFQDPKSSMTLQAGTPYLLNSSQAQPTKIAAVDKYGQLSTWIDVDPRFIAGQTCPDRSSTNSSLVALVNSPLYSDSSMQTAPACTVKAGSVISGRCTISGGSASTGDEVSFDAMAAMCGGLQKAYGHSFRTLTVYSQSSK